MPKKVRRPSTDPVNGSVPLELCPVPETGSITVCLLSAYSGILTHRVRNRPLACPGVEECPQPIHRGVTIWKGYAAAQLWRPEPHRDWIAVVLEVTERLAEVFGQKGQRGEVWELYRQPGRYSRPECAGRFVEHRDTEALRTDVRIEPVVERVYRARVIQWDCQPLFKPRPQLAPSADRPPPGPAANGKHPSPDRITRQQFNEIRALTGKPPVTDAEWAARNGGAK